MSGAVDFRLDPRRNRGILAFVLGGAAALPLYSCFGWCAYCSPGRNSGALACNDEAVEDEASVSPLLVSCPPNER